MYTQMNPNYRNPLRRSKVSLDPLEYRVDVDWIFYQSERVVLVVGAVRSLVLIPVCLHPRVEWE